MRSEVLVNRVQPRGFGARLVCQYDFMMERYKDHVVRSLRGKPGLRSWCIGSPDGSSWYSFRVTEHPGGITLTGDTVNGAGVVIAKPLGWFLGSANARYLASKTSLRQGWRADLFDDWCIEELAAGFDQAVATGEWEDDERNKWEARQEAIREAQQCGAMDDIHGVFDALPQRDTDDGLPAGWDYSPVDVANIRAIGDTLRRLMGDNHA
jgi:hypothetical protein